jgi:hypothetical protein
MFTRSRYKFDFVRQHQLSDGDYNEASRATNEYSVSLINGNDLKGSATLVSIGKSFGLLTAHHVWQAVRKGKCKDHFCMVLGSKHGRFEHPFDECTPLAFGEYSADHEEEGPDLAFIRFDYEPRILPLKVKKSFYPLEAEKGQMFNDIPYDRCPWLVWGTPAEGTVKSASETGQPILRVNQFAGGAEFSGIIERDGFDFVKVKITCGRNGFPNDYGGVSGGGVWIPIRYSEDPERKVLKPPVNLLLAGVAYYQSEEIRGYKTLNLHGPKSIYDRVIRRALQNVNF